MAQTADYEFEVGDEVILHIPESQSDFCFGIVQEMRALEGVTVVIEEKNLINGGYYIRDPNNDYRWIWDPRWMEPAKNENCISFDDFASVVE